MNCFAHSQTPAVGMCGLCQKGVCRECVARAAPRLVCRECAATGGASVYPWWGGYGFGFEYRSSIAIGTWPLVHICSGIDPLTMRPRIAKGIVAIGNIAVGLLAIGGVACGVFTLGGVSIGLLLALGGVSLGVGLSLGGLAVGSVAIGGLAVGFVYGIGGAAVGPSVIDAQRCDEAARDFARRWLSLSTPSCR